jgi:hypothetical protein
MLGETFRHPKPDPAPPAGDERNPARQQIFPKYARHRLQE